MTNTPKLPYINLKHNPPRLPKKLSPNQPSPIRAPRKNFLHPKKNPLSGGISHVLHQTHYRVNEEDPAALAAGGGHVQTHKRVSHDDGRTRAAGGWCMCVCAREHGRDKDRQVCREGWMLCPPTRRDSHSFPSERLKACALPLSPSASSCAHIGGVPRRVVHCWDVRKWSW